jgi:thiosulfate/3-mercaptopyruvate sulfurtransferase
MPANPPVSPAAMLITPAELAALRDAREALVILDARFEKGAGGAWAEPDADRIPGALFVDIPTELSGKSSPLAGKRPLPEVRALQESARRWGINKNSVVVVYDQNKNVQAARVWWVLRWAGVRDVRLLDGGFKAWVKAGYPVTRETKAPAIGNVSLAGDNLPVADADGAAANAVGGIGILIDARSRESYVGVPNEAGKPPAGHIPGALNAPSGNNLEPDGRFRPLEELKALYDGLGIDGSRPVVVYCGSGIAATHDIFALHLIGYSAALFPGSWSAWSADPARPVAVGDDAVSGARAQA